jgi:hypothetical protein
MKIVSDTTNHKTKVVGALFFISVWGILFISRKENRRKSYIRISGKTFVFLLLMIGRIHIQEFEVWWTLCTLLDLAKDGALQKCLVQLHLAFRAEAFFLRRVYPPNGKCWKFMVGHSR